MARTKIKSKNLYENRNTSDIFARLIIMGVLKILNQKLTYQQIWEDSEDGIQNVTVPFFFDFSGGSGSSEKFIQDNYTNWTDDECTSMGLKKMSGDYKPIPYGVITLDSTTIDSGNISNRFVMGKYTKKVNGEMKSYVSCLYSIPLTMSFTVNIGCDTMNTLWKIEQAYREFFYKNKTFHINYKGTVVPCRIGFPESIGQSKTSNYVFGAQSTDGTPDIKLSFNLSCETYQPVFDPYTEMEADNNIKSFTSKITFQEGIDKEKVSENGIIKVEPIKHTNITSEQDILLRWVPNYNYSDLLHVDILYQEENGELELLDSVDNHDCYHLEFSNDFVENPTMIDVIVLNNENCTIINSPKIKLYPDEANIVNESNAIVIDPGYILTDNKQIEGIISYEDKEGKQKEIKALFNISNNGIDLENPICFNPFIYNQNYEYKKIKLYVRDHDKPDIISCFQNDDEWIYVY